MRSFPWQNESAQRTVHGNEAAIKTPTLASTLSSARTWLSDRLAATTQHTLTHTQCRTHAHHLNFTSRRATKYFTAASSVLADSTENEQGKGQGAGKEEGEGEKKTNKSKKKHTQKEAEAKLLQTHQMDGKKSKYFYNFLWKSAHSSEQKKIYTKR